MIGGDCDGDGATDNDFNTLEIVGAANAEIADVNNLIITNDDPNNLDAITVTNQLWLAAGTGGSGMLTLDGLSLIHISETTRPY